MKKIIFNDRFGLTDAVLEGRKTMTRRIIRNLSDFDPRQDWMHWSDNGKANIAIIHNETYKYCIYPQYQPGEVVAVAQAYKDIRNGGYPVDSRYDAFRTADFDFGENGVLRGTAGEKNKMFVRADLMPHQIRITDIKVERLQNISDEDCMREGITMMTEGKNEIGNGYGWDTKIDALKRESFFTPKAAFAALIDKISGKGTWERNPYVFAYTFELIK